MKAAKRPAACGRPRSRRLARLRPALLLAWLACSAPDASSESAQTAQPAASAPERASVAIAGRVFELELALEPAARMTGLSGRGALPDYGGMLFVLPRPQPFYLVMRDCAIPIGAAFLDSDGRVLAVAEMRVEPPRGRDERDGDYESRLPRYGSPSGVRFAAEVQGGRLTQLGVAVGQQVVIPGAEQLLRRAK